MNNNKKFIISSIICLLPILLGIILWRLLPENLVGEIWIGGYSFSSKKIVAFIYPFIFFVLHYIVVFKSDWLNTPKSKMRYWYMPIFSNAFFLISLMLSL